MLGFVLLIVLAGFVSASEIHTYELDEGSGTIAIDDQASKNMTHNAAYVTDKDGGTALSFAAGTGDEMSFTNAHTDLWTEQSDHSFSAWFNFSSSSFSSSQAFIGGEAGGESGLSLDTDGTNIRCFLGDGTLYRTTYAVGSVPLGTWTNIVCTYDKATTTIKMYVDSVNVANQTSAPGWTWYAGTPSWCVGGDNAGAGPGCTTTPSVMMIDEIRVFDHELNQTEINDIYTGNVTPTPDPPVFIPPSPANATQNNTQVTYSINCSNNNVYAWFNTSLVIENVTGVANYTTSIGASGEYEMVAGCYNVSLDSFSTNVSRTWYFDEVFPAIASSFVNGSIWYLGNLTTQFNFTDDFYLNSFNITIDGTEVASNVFLVGTNASFNLVTDISNLSEGSHILKVVLADGHTAKAIKDYDVNKGLFSNYLRYSWKDAAGTSKSVKISVDGGSVLDTFDTEKQLDRYIFDFQPYDIKNSYTFVVETDEEIRIIEDNSTYLHSWIIFGDKWLDFYLPDENASIKITEQGKKKVKIKVSNIQHPERQIYHSIGDLNIISANYTFFKVNASTTYQETLFEGSLTTLDLNVEMPDLLNYDVTAGLLWNNASQNVSRLNVSGDEIQFSSTFVVPDVNDTNVSWTWFFNVSGYEFNTSGLSQFISMNITNCSAGNYVVLNYTIYDEGTLAASSGVNASIENYLTLTTPGYPNSYNFSVKVENDNLLICLPNGTLDNSTFYLDALTKYTYQDHVEEFHYIEDFLLTSSNIPKIISLYDLETADSTSFLVTYQDENYLYVEGVIVDLLRQYISEDGAFYSVEHGKTDAGGQTRLHFVTEDVIYKANVWQNGVLVYTSGEFQALCQASPCQINLRQPYSVSNESISTFDGWVYDITSQVDFYTSKKITFDWSTNDGTSTSINLAVIQSNGLGNVTICNSTKVLSAGSIVCTIPISYYNSTYEAKVYKDGEFVGWRSYSLELSPDDTFGKTGVFLAGIGFLLLAFMGISSPIASIVLGIIGLMSMIGVNVLDGGSLFGIGSTFIWLLIAAAILIWKFQQRRVQ